MSDEDNFDLPEDADNYVEVEIFEQILEMDDGDPERDFSRGLVLGFFEQADSTFDQMHGCLKDKDLDQLSSLGHFLKGSSATLGLFKVRDICEKIQHLGAKKDETGVDSISDSDALGQIAKLLPEMQEDYSAAKAWLRKYFEMDEEDERD